MAKNFSVFVNIGAKVDGSVASAFGQVESRIGRFSRLLRQSAHEMRSVFREAGAATKEVSRLLAARAGVHGSLGAAGHAAKAGAELQSVRVDMQKPIVDTSSIDAATVAAERLKAVLATVGGGNINLGGGSAGGGDSSGGGAPAVARVGRSVTGGGGTGRAFTGSLNERDMNPEVVAYIRAAAEKRGIDPKTALAVADGEGLRGFGPNRPVVGDQGTSHGPFQLHYAGGTGGNRQRGLGDAFTKATGLHARDPATYRAQVDYALDHAAKHGWKAWYGRAHHRIGIWDGIGQRPAAKVKPAPAAAEAGAVLNKGVEIGKLAGARATGGPVSRGLSYLVGERGPEVFTPGASGAISTNGALARLTDLGSRMTSAADGGTSPDLAPSPKVVAQLRPQGGNVSTRGDTSIHSLDRPGTPASRVQDRHGADVRPFGLGRPGGPEIAEDGLQRFRARDVDLRPGLRLREPDGLAVELRPAERDQVAATLAGVQRHEGRKPYLGARHGVELGEVLGQPHNFGAVDLIDPLERRQRMPVDHLAVEAELQDAREPGELRVGRTRRVLGQIVPPFEEDRPCALPLDRGKRHRPERLLDGVDVELLDLARACGEVLPVRRSLIGADQAADRRDRDRR